MCLGISPARLPALQTVYGYFAAWRENGTTEQVHDLLRRTVRCSRGRAEEPTAFAIDSQSVKSSGNAQADTVGYDGNKKIKGRRRHIAVDTLGLLIVLGIAAGSHQDSPIGKQVLTCVAAVAPTVTKPGSTAATTTRWSITEPTSASTSKSSAETRSPTPSKCCRADGWRSGPLDGSCSTDA
jgi:transposase